MKVTGHQSFCNVKLVNQVCYLQYAALNSTWSLDQLKEVNRQVFHVGLRVKAFIPVRELNETLGLFSAA